MHKTILRNTHLFWKPAGFFFAVDAHFSRSLHQTLLKYKGKVAADRKKNLYELNTHWTVSS